MTVQEAKSLAQKTLTASPSPSLDADVLLQNLLGLDKTQLLFKRQMELPKEKEELFLQQVKLRATGLPVAYITGVKEFYGYSFHVSPAVLIPKPDTEILVEEGLKILQEKMDAYSSSTSTIPKHLLTIMDMCTGSGCVGISLFRVGLENGLFTEETAPTVTLADISDKALETARQNALELIPPSLSKNIRFLRTNLFQMVKGRFDMILSNPPYIPHDETMELLKDGRREPILALDGDIDLLGMGTGENDGLGIMRNLVPQAYSHLCPLGALLCESGEYNALQTQELFKQAGFTNTSIVPDLEGQLRVTKGTVPFTTGTFTTGTFTTGTFTSDT